MPKNLTHLSTLHPIDAFGIQKVSMSGIRVERLEDRVRPAVPFPHKHDFFQLILVTKGKGQHRIDFQLHPVRPGQLYVMKPGQTHSWKLERGIKGIIVEFNVQSLNAVKEGPALIRQISLCPDVLTMSDDALFSIMLEESREKKDRYDLGLQALVTATLIKILRLSPLKQEKSLPNIEKFRELLESHFREHHAVEFYARELKTSAKALTMQLSRSIGKPPRDLIQERILLEAKRYLAFSDLSISEIGYEIGFEDPNYFTRFFRVHERQSPAKFRLGAVANP